jgi:hypothetical protein
MPQDYSQTARSQEQELVTTTINLKQMKSLQAQSSKKINLNQIMNAFHPDYVETYMPEIIKATRLESKQTVAGQTLTAYVDEIRKQKPLHGTLSGMSKTRVSTKPLEFMYYSRAGVKNTTAKKKG